MDDYIVDEIRKIRDEHAKKFDYNISAICADFRQKQEKYKDKLVSLKPKKIKENIV